MWAPVQATSAPASTSQGSPIARSKHAMCVTQDGHIYLFGGRSANLPLKDLWRFDPGQNQWEEVKCRGQYPPNLQEHSMVAWNNKLYVFGGEIGFSSNVETPLWILDLATCTWKKQTADSLPRGSSGTQPTGRRGHSAVLYGDAMHVFGGYQDLRGSSSELWTFDFFTEQWHLMSGSGTSSGQPAARHSHSAVVHENCMYVYGGMTDLQNRCDLWKWDFVTRKWHKIKNKSNKGPGQLHGHTAIKAFGSMFVFGGERDGSLLQELWRFQFGTETWERMNAEGVLPNSRCRHTAVANPFLVVNELDESNCKVLRLNSTKTNCNSESENTNKALTMPSKSISMCFGQAVDSPLHINGKPLKSFKFRVHPMSAFCSGKSATISDDENEEDENNKHIKTSKKKSLKDKISQSRLVRSISSNSYNFLHQSGCSAEALKDELERLVEESTPQMTRPKEIEMESNLPPGIGLNKINNNYRRLKSRMKMQKSMSSHAVLESDSESSTPQHHCSNRPRSEVIQTQSVGCTPLEEEEYIDDVPWSKRHTIHESMSYYSLCFPTPPQSKSGSESSVDNNCAFQNLSLLNGDPVSSITSGESENRDVQSDNNELSPSPEKENAKTLIDLDENSSSAAVLSPVDGRPKSSGYNSLVTLYTPTVENRGISHSVSHSSGYHSFTDETLYDHKELIDAFQQQVQNSTSFSRKSFLRHQKEITSPMEMKYFGGKQLPEQNQIGENGNSLPQLRLSKESRARSWDRTSLRKDGRTSFEYGSNRNSWQPQINAIKEVVVPGSPSIRKWTYSPVKTRTHQHHWQLCMYIFGGKEVGVSGIYKQPMSIWKLYI